jgi:hypothetical protein
MEVLDVLSIVNAGVCAGLCLMLGWVVMSPTVQDGVVIKFGLIISSLGLLACALILLQHDGAGSWRPLLTAWLLVHIGTLVAAVGVVVRVFGDPHAREVMHAATGWPPLSDEPDHAGRPR